jgi:Rab family protein
MVDSSDSSYNGEGINPNNLIRHKIVFVGDLGVGKTSIIYRLLENKFKENYEPSIGVDFCSKSIRYKGKYLKLQIWDSAGQERYKSLIPNYVRGSSIIFICYDVSSFLN